MINQQVTPAFKQWFSASAAITENGSPLDLYHGTDVRFSEFRPSPSGMFGAGIYLTPYSGNAQEYGRFVMKVFASLQNPLRGTALEVKAMRLPRETDAQFTSRLQLFGFDGIIVIDACDTPYTVVAFESQQVKVATQNIWASEIEVSSVRH